MPTKEQIYDDEINPLMAQILALCKEHHIAMLADFALDGDLHCTSAVLPPEYRPSQSQLKALELLKPQPAFGLAETTETLPDGSKKVTIRRIS